MKYYRHPTGNPRSAHYTGPGARHLTSWRASPCDDNWTDDDYVDYILSDAALRMLKYFGKVGLAFRVPDDDGADEQGEPD